MNGKTFVKLLALLWRFCDAADGHHRLRQEQKRE